MAQKYILNRGEFHQLLVAGLENEKDLPVPEKILQSYKQVCDSLPKTPFLKIPPHIQSIYVELARVTTDLERLPIQATGLDRAELKRRIAALQHLKICLILEFIPADQVPSGDLNLVAGPGWNLYLGNRKPASTKTKS